MLGPITSSIMSSAKCEISFSAASSFGGKKYPDDCWCASMKKRPGYWTASSNSTWFSGIWIVPRSRFGSKLHAVARRLWSRSSGAVTGWMNTSRLRSRCAFAQSIRAVRSYSSFTDASPPAGSFPWGVPVIQPNAGRTPTCERAAACEVGPSITPRQKAASLRPASRLAMLSGVPTTMIDIGTPRTLVPAG
jgi:hypothetical protein